MNSVDYKKLVWVSGLIAIATILAFIKVRKISFGINIDTVSLIGTIAGINWIAWLVFKKWLWKLRIFSGWLVMIPDLNGCWKGTLQSTWIDEATGESVAPIVTTATVKQDLTTITIDFVTNEMTSRSIVAEISCDTHRRVAEISYIYKSEPEATVKSRSAMHYGSAKLTYGKTKNAETLKGDYWTDRKTTGTIVLKRASR